MSQMNSGSWPQAPQEPQRDRKTADMYYDRPPHTPEATHQLDGLDQEMLDEAHDSDEQHEHPSEKSDQQEEAELDKHLQWIPHGENINETKSHAELPVSVVVPQTAPGIKNPFSRAWSPVLTDHGVQPQHFLHFIDHLNVCKTASPPLQLLNLAGTVVGFTPVPFAWAISMGTSVVSTAGTIAVAKVRITRYLERVNKLYFHPRGLLARIAKQNVLPRILHQPAEAPLLAPLPPTMGYESFPSLRDRRVQALGQYIAPLHFESSTDVSTEGNVLDKVSAKMTAFTAQRSEYKMAKKQMKHHDKDMKHNAKRLEKASRHGDSSEVAHLEAGMHAQEMQQGYHGKGAEKEQRAASKFLFVVIQSLEAAKETAAQEQDVPDSLK